MDTIKLLLIDNITCQAQSIITEISRWYLGKQSVGDVGTLQCFLPILGQYCLFIIALLHGRIYSMLDQGQLQVSIDNNNNIIIHVKILLTLMLVPFFARLFPFRTDSPFEVQTLILSENSLGKFCQHSQYFASSF